MSLDVAGVVVVVTQLDQLWSVGTDHVARRLDVLEVLPTGRVAASGRGDEDERTTDAIPRHLPNGLGEEWLPVPSTPVDRQCNVVLGELVADGRNECSGCGVDR